MMRNRGVLRMGSKHESGDVHTNRLVNGATMKMLMLGNAAAAAARPP